jgi:hypothetical protein
MPSIRGLVTFALSLSALACVPPRPPVQILTESANDVVNAARFGRMDLVLEAVDPRTRDSYAATHSDWGGRIRILDMEYGGTRLTTPDEAVVLVNVSWQRVDESILRGTALKQKWVRLERRWVISEEAVAGGHKGLLKAADPTDVEGAADKLEDPDALPLSTPGWGDDSLGVGVGSGL